MKNKITNVGIQYSFYVKIHLMKINKILFPFHHNKQLNDKWWNRMFVVFFFIIIIVTFLIMFRNLNAGDGSGYLACISLNGYSQSTQCETQFPVHIYFNAIFAFAVVIIESYVLQILYFKIILYIIFGKDK